MWLIRAIPVRKRVTNVISLSRGVKWALGAEGTVTVWSRWGSSSLRRYWRMTGKKPQRERVEAEYSTVMVGRCSGYDPGPDIGPSVMISAVRCCDTSIIRGRCSPLQPHLPLGLTNRHLRNACGSVMDRAGGPPRPPPTWWSSAGDRQGAKNLRFNGQMTQHPEHSIDHAVAGDTTSRTVKARL